MKKLLFWLLNNYTHTEKGRIEILMFLDEKVKNDYSEQSTFGNVYNFYIEFLMANKLINKLIKESDYECLKVLRNGLTNTFDEVIEYTRNESTGK